MLVAVLGSCTPFSFWGFSVVNHIVQVVLGDHRHVHCNSMAELMEGVAGGRDQHVVITTDFPDSDVAELLRKHAVPTIAFIDRPAEATAFAMTNAGFTMPQAVTLLSYRFCAVHNVLRSGEVLFFDGQSYEGVVQDVVRSIYDFLPKAKPHQTFEQNAQLLMPNNEGLCTVLSQLRLGTNNAKTPDECLADLPDEQRITTKAWCEGFEPIFVRQELQTVRLPSDIMSFSPIGGDETGHFQLTGPRRCLMWGPYVHLPEGRWLAKCQLEVAHNPSGARIAVDVLAGDKQVALVQATLPIQGVFASEIAFDVERFNWRIELRLHLLEGMIEGELVVRNTEFVRVADLTLSTTTRPSLIGQLTA